MQPDLENSYDQSHTVLHPSPRLLQLFQTAGIIFGIRGCSIITSRIGGGWVLYLSTILIQSR